ncbi:ATP-binding protein [Nonomuraea sp. NPDC048882]|uniref:ATP-binding protein n=1 Tax=Nonomuraea sp. NPDC048882 TaxID=3154347 RepID=UPI0033EB964F
MIEGLSHVDDPDEVCEAVDVSEYFGGETLEASSAVDLSQLKYSTKHPGKAWTVSRLCRARVSRAADGSVASKRSVIADLAGIYVGLLAKLDRAEIQRKVRIRLVSNQPGDPLTQEAVAEAARWARSQRPGKRRDGLLMALTDPQHANVVQKLSDGVGQALTSEQFCDFLAVLDLSQTGSLGRAALARGVQARAASLTPGRDGDSALQLFEMVRREALPESPRKGLRAADVLASLGLTDPQGLYPAPTRLAPLNDPLPALGVPLIAESVLAHPGEIVVVHGPAGAGKTTAIRQLGDHLPPGSVVTLYDCYGGGEYLSSGEERHTPQRFILQTINDVARQCGSPLLVRPPASDEDLWRRLRRALEDAVKTLDPDAVLVLAVDAADNAAYAADKRGDRGFLSGLVGLPLPSRAAVVLTARSHRVESLAASDAPQVRLAPFDQSTSTAHLLRYRPEASPEDAATFHQRTDGNPRAQYYALTQAETNEWDMPALLEACTRTPIPLFKGLLESALQVSGADAGGQRWLGAMLALARPISVATLAAALDVPMDAVVAFAHGLAPGVVLVDGAIQFRDEDFETYVRDRVDTSDVIAAHDRLAEMFLTNRTVDADAAAHVADHLAEAGRLDDVLTLVLSEGWPEAIPDGFRRAQVQGRRLDLAARAAATIGDGAAAVRIAVRACDTASRQDTLSSLVKSHFDLVTRHTDIDDLRAHAGRQTADHEWHAPTQMRVAAVLARDPARRTEARTELERADAWLRRQKVEASRVTRAWSLDADDMASAAGARYRLDGLEAALRELSRCRPEKFALDVAAALAAQIAAEVGPGPLRNALRAQNVPTALQAPFLAYASSPAAPPDRAWLDEVIAAVLVTNAGNAEPWHRRLITAVVRHGDRRTAAALAEHCARRPLSPYRWAFNNGNEVDVATLRCHAFAAVLGGTDISIDDLIPPSLQPEDKDTAKQTSDDRRSHDRREWIEMVQPLLAAALLAAHCAIGEANRDEVTAFVVAGLAERIEKAGHRWFTFDTSYRAWAALAADAVVVSAADITLIGQLADAALVLLKNAAPALWLDLAAHLTIRGGHTGPASDLCARAAEYVQKGTYPASERLELLADAADVADRFAPELGEQLFRYAVDAATGINDDAARLLSVYADLAERAVLSDSDRPTVATRLVRAAESVALHVSDEGLVPYEVVAGAAGRLSAEVALGAVSRWDDEGRIPMTETLPRALVGAVEGGGVLGAQALALAHLVEDDDARLWYRLAVIDVLRKNPSDIADARVALKRTVDWIRRDVPTHAQPTLANRLLDWAAERSLDGPIRLDLEAVARLGLNDPDTGDKGANANVSANKLLLPADPSASSMTTLADDVAELAANGVYGERMREFITKVAMSAGPQDRVATLTAVAGLCHLANVQTVLPVIARCLTQWRQWPGVSEWATTALPPLLTGHLPDIAWSQNTDELLEQLRQFADDDAIRRAVLTALPVARAHLTPFGWQNIAALLGRLCDRRGAAEAVIALLDDRLPRARDGEVGVVTLQAEPVTLLLWSVFGHPRRAIRWRAAYAVRELLIYPNLADARQFAGKLVACLGRTDAAAYRDPALHFYRMSAVAGLLVALQRVAVQRPDVLTAYLPDLIVLATSRELPHAQIRELARQTALALADPTDSDFDVLQAANQPATCSVQRTDGNRSGNQGLPNGRRYRFDDIDTIPYWYTPLAHAFNVPVQVIAERAERWILDVWGLTQEDWWRDNRELRDQRSYQRMSHRHGSIPPEENLRLYIEYHAMMVVAGELVDAGLPIHVPPYNDEEDPWWDWLAPHLPSSFSTWVSDLRHPVPAEPSLFGHLPPLDAWDIPLNEDYDDALGLVDGRIGKELVVAGHTEVNRSGAFGKTHIWSALVTPEHAADLQRALAAAPNPTDWKLPEEDEGRFEVDHGLFVLRGWLVASHSDRDWLDEHDPYAYGLHAKGPLPGRLFRQVTGVGPDLHEVPYVTGYGVEVVRTIQWADPRTDDTNVVTTSGHRLLVVVKPLLRFLSQTGMNLIVEVQIGRHRSSATSDEYRFPRSRIYLIAPDGHVTGR